MDVFPVRGGPKKRAFRYFSDIATPSFNACS